MLKFKTDLESLDERSVFANRILKLIYDKHNGDIDSAIKEIKPILDGLEEFVRNIYELIDNEIPLYHYYELLENGADDFDLTEDEYQEWLQITRKACVYYYK